MTNDEYDISHTAALASLYSYKRYIYYAYPYPYLVVRYDQNGSVIDEIELSDKSFTPPEEPKIVDGIMLGSDLNSRISSILVLEEYDYLLVEVMEKEQEERRIDVFNSVGQFVGSFSIPNTQHLTSYRDGYLLAIDSGGFPAKRAPSVILYEVSDQDMRPVFRSTSGARLD